MPKKELLFIVTLTSWTVLVGAIFFIVILSTSDLTSSKTLLTLLICIPFGVFASCLIQIFTSREIIKNTKYNKKQKIIIYTGLFSLATLIKNAH